MSPLVPFEDVVAAVECAARARRAGMTDEEFWVDVAAEMQPVGEAEPDEDSGDFIFADVPCPICDAPGACAYDAEGRPLIHTTPEGDDA